MIRMSHTFVSLLDFFSQSISSVRRQLLDLLRLFFGECTDGIGRLEITGFGLCTWHCNRFIDELISNVHRIYREYALNSMHLITVPMVLQHMRDPHGLGRSIRALIMPIDLAHQDFSPGRWRTIADGFISLQHCIDQLSRVSSCCRRSIASPAATYTRLMRVQTSTCSPEGFGNLLVIRQETCSFPDEVPLSISLAKHALIRPHQHTFVPI